jgi:NADPH:quinone reductase-like Zn-dependent oxidoreductase
MDAGIKCVGVHANLDRTFPLEQMAAAHAYMEENRTGGKVVGIP